MIIFCTLITNRELDFLLNFYIMIFFKVIGFGIVTFAYGENPAQASKNAVGLLLFMFCMVGADYVADKLMPLDSESRLAMNFYIPQEYMDNPWFKMKDGRLGWNDALSGKKVDLSALAASGKNVNVHGDGNIIMYNSNDIEDKVAYVRGARFGEIVKINGTEFVSDPHVLLRKAIVDNLKNQKSTSINSIENSSGIMPHSQVEGLSNVQPVLEVVNISQPSSDAIASNALSFGEAFLSCYDSFSSFIF